MLDFLHQFLVNFGCHLMLGRAAYIQIVGVCLQETAAYRIHRIPYVRADERPVYI